MSPHLVRLWSRGTDKNGPLTKVAPVSNPAPGNGMRVRLDGLLRSSVCLCTIFYAFLYVFVRFSMFLLYDFVRLCMSFVGLCIVCGCILYVFLCFFKMILLDSYRNVEFGSGGTRRGHNC